MTEQVAHHGGISALEVLLDGYRIVDDSTATIRTLQAEISQATNLVIPEARARFLMEHADDIASGATAAQFDDPNAYHLFLARISQNSEPDLIDNNDRLLRTAELIGKFHTSGAIAAIQASNPIRLSGSPHHKWSVGRLTGEVNVQVDVPVDESRPPSYACARLVLSSTMKDVRQQEIPIGIDIGHIYDSTAISPLGYRCKPAVAIGPEMVRRELEWFFPSDGRDADSFQYHEDERGLMEAMVVGGLRLSDVGYAPDKIDAERERVVTRLEKADSGEVGYTYEALRLAAVTTSNRAALTAIEKVMAMRPGHEHPLNLRYHHYILSQYLEPVE